MGSVIELSRYREKAVHSETLESPKFKDSRRTLAYEMILKASQMLSDIGEKERRIAWILEDCVELLEER